MLATMESLIQKLYHSYRHTSDIDKKGLFFSPTCMQICRPTPAYSATTRAQIVQYLKDAQDGQGPSKSATVESDGTAALVHDGQAFSTAAINGTVTWQSDGRIQEEPAATDKVRGVYTIRPLHPTERTDFSTLSVTSAINLTPAQLLQKSQDENWIGMRVDLWYEGPATEESLLVKVQYWWRKESVKPGEEVDGDERGMGWSQCLHDIMYLGWKDGTEGEEGLVVKE